MLRYMISFPVGANIRPEQLAHLRDMLKEAVNDKEWRDIIASEGATIVDLRQHGHVRVPQIVKHARAKAR